MSTAKAIKAPVNDAAAILAAEVANAAKLDARTVAKTAFFAKVTDLGAQAASASTTVVDLALAFQAAVREGHVTGGEAKAVYQSYADGFKRTVAEQSLQGRGAELMSDQSIATQSSVLKTFAEPAAIAIGDDLYRMVIEVRRGLATEEKTGSAYSNMAAANRKLAAFAKDFARIEDCVAAVDMDKVREWIAKGAVEPKGDRDKLKAFVDAGLKLAKADFSTDGEFVALVQKLQQYQAQLLAGKVPGAELIKSTANEENRGNVTIQ